MSSRASARQRFVARFLGKAFAIHPLAGDASFRRYFRIEHVGERFVLMDAPPPHEDASRFIRLANWLRSHGLRTPKIFAADEQTGLVLLEDFGDRTWAVHLAEGGQVDALFADAWRQLVLLQCAPQHAMLLAFDEARMHAELDLYLDWYLPHVAGIAPSAEEHASFHQAFSSLIVRLAAQPKVVLHLDFHSRNLMLPPDGLPLGVLDFQDAAIGHASYDAASLLYDCYQDYPEPVRRRWSKALYAELPRALQRAYGGFEAWHRAVRQAALQRHIKAIGIFARLAYRDGKRQFLDEIPLTRKHLAEELLALGNEGAVHPLLQAEPLGRLEEEALVKGR